MKYMWTDMNLAEISFEISWVVLLSTVYHSSQYINLWFAILAHRFVNCVPGFANLIYAVKDLQTVGMKNMCMDLYTGVHIYTWLYFSQLAKHCVQWTQGYIFSSASTESLYANANKHIIRCMFFNGTFLPFAFHIFLN